jgi:hypothetical protein
MRIIGKLIAWPAFLLSLVVVAFSAYWLVIAAGEVEQRGAGGAVSELVFAGILVVGLGGTIASGIALWLLHRNPRKQ